MLGESQEHSLWLQLKGVLLHGATDMLQRHLKTIFSKKVCERFPVLGNWKRREMSMPQEILYFCFFLEYQWLRFLLTFWDLSDTFVHRLLKNMLNFSFWRSVGLKHIKCLAKVGHRALSLLQFTAYNANKLSWLCHQGSCNIELELTPYVNLPLYQSLIQ